MNFNIFEKKQKPDPLEEIKNHDKAVNEFEESLKKVDTLLPPYLVSQMKLLSDEDLIAIFNKSNTEDLKKLILRIGVDAGNELVKRNEGLTKLLERKKVLISLNNWN